MRGINSVCVSGNLARDAELKSFDNGGSVLNFTVCVNTSKRLDDGSYEDVPNFVDCQMSGRRAEKLADRLTKGTFVALQGTLRQDKWVAKDGTNRSRLKVIVIEIHYEQRGQAAPEPMGYSEAPTYDADCPF